MKRILEIKRIVTGEDSHEAGDSRALVPVPQPGAGAANRGNRFSAHFPTTPGLSATLEIFCFVCARQCAKRAPPIMCHVTHGLPLHSSCARRRAGIKREPSKRGWLDRLHTTLKASICAEGTAGAQQQPQSSVSGSRTVMASTKDAAQPTAISGVGAATEPRAEVPPPSLTHPLPEHRIQARSPSPQDIPGTRV